MIKLRAICMVMLIAGLAGLASAQTVTVSTSPAGSITYGTPVRLQSVLKDIADCNNPSFFVDFFVLPLAPTVPVGTVTPVLEKGLKDLPCDADLAPISNLPVGSWTIEAIYENATNTPPSGTTTLTVTQASTTISLLASPNPSTYGQIVQMTVTLTPATEGPSAPTGFITFFVDGKEESGGPIGSDGPSGVGAGDGGMAAGTHSLTASYSGDSNYLASVSTAVIQVVNRISTTTSLQAVPPSSTFGQSVALAATVSPSKATGTVTFLDGSTNLGSAPLSAGIAILPTSTLSVGSHSLTASYGGDTNDAPSVSTPVTETVSQDSTTTSLTAVPASSTFGQSVALTATVSPSTATGTVTFLDGSNTIGKATLTAGTASFSTSSLSVGSHSLTVSYGGDTNDAPSVSTAVTETVGKASTTTSLKAVPGSSTPGQAVVLTATVSPSTATGTVFFLDGSTTIGSALLSAAGTASFSTSTLSIGNHSLTSSYGGDTDDAPGVSSPVTVAVGLVSTTTSLQAVPTSSAPGQSVVLTATVSPSAATGTVFFLDGSATIGSAPLTAGTASFSTSSLSAGSHSLTASYAGDTNDAASVSTIVTVSVARLTTTTVLVAAPNPALVGQTVTLTATVSPGNPTGTISFSDGASLLGTTAVASGVAALSTSTLSSGSHSLTASYSGDTNNAPSTSAAVTESVTGGATTPAYTISTFAGSAAQTDVRPQAVAVDSAGNVFFTSQNAVLRLESATGSLTLAAGNGTAGFSGDKGPATSAQLNGPKGIAVDASGDLYIADTANHRIRKVTNGVIATIAGDGLPGFSGDNGPAAGAQLNSPYGVAVDSAGNLYIADSSNHRIRKVANGDITTVAGNGAAGFSGDNGPAAGAGLSFPSGVAVDSAGNLYIADHDNHRIRKVANGVIGSVPVTELNGPTAVAVDAAGNLYIADRGNRRIRKVTNGVVTTVAGGGSGLGDNGPATSAQLRNPVGVAVDSDGNLYIADSDDNRIRKVANGMIATVAGGEASPGDGGPATSAQLSSPNGVAVDSAGNVYIADTDDNLIREVSNGVITTVAGGGSSLGDNGPATSAQLISPYGVAVDSAGNLYIADTSNHRVRKVSNGVITTVAGNGTAGFSGDSGPATSAELGQVEGIAVDSAGDLYIADTSNNRVRKVTSGVITTVAGNGTAGFSGDNGAATSAQLHSPAGVATDLAGDLYIADTGSNRIRKVTSGVINTVAGGGSSLGDNGPPTSAQLGQPNGVAVDSAGNLYIADTANQRIRMVANGVIDTIAGNGTFGFGGDNGPATSAQLANPFGIAVESGGDIYVADQANNRIRLLQPVATSFLTVSKKHTGNFTQGQQGAGYTVTVSNGASGGATSGLVTVIDTIPNGLILASMAGTGWSCSGNTCTRSDALNAGASYPAITVTVNVASNAASQVTNQVIVFGGGSDSAGASDVTTINANSSACSIGLSPGSASLPATGTSTVETCPNNSGQPNCGVSPETPVTFTVTPGAHCGAWTATSSNPEFLQVTSGAGGTGTGAVSYALLNNTHTSAQTYNITVASGGASATYTVTGAGSGDSQVYREVYALYEQLLGRDPDPAGFAFWTGSGGAGLGQMADSFLTSPEAFNSDFAVMAAYQAATGAPPTFAQFTAAVSSIRLGAQTVPGLFNSLTGSGFSATNLYQNLLNRAPAGADSTCTSMPLASCFQTIIGYPSNTTPVGAANNEFQSTGTFHTAADHTNTLYLQMVYYVTLSRDPDPAGFAFWLGIANSGGAGLLFQGSTGYSTRIQILGPGTPNQGFIGSPEFQGLFAN